MLRTPFMQRKAKQTIKREKPIFDLKNGIILRSHTSRKWVMSKIVWHKNMKNKIFAEKASCNKPGKNDIYFDILDVISLLYYTATNVTV